MKKEIKELWNELQGLDEEAQLDLLEAFAMHMFNQGVGSCVNDDVNDNDSLWDVSVGKLKLK